VIAAGRGKTYSTDDALPILSDMIHATLSILLATSIAACPLLCKLGSACCAAQSGAVQQTCCRGCHSETKDDSQAPRSPSDHSPEKCRQCVCGGALLEKSSLADIQLESHWSLPAPILYATVASAGQSRFELYSTPLRPEDGNNPGRVLRQLYMTFLC
jgi:hypothetical protein